MQTTATLETSLTLLGLPGSLRSLWRMTQPTHVQSPIPSPVPLTVSRTCLLLAADVPDPAADGQPGQRQQHQRRHSGCQPDVARRRAALTSGPVRGRRRGGVSGSRGGVSVRCRVGAVSGEVALRDGGGRGGKMEGYGWRTATFWGRGLTRGRRREVEGH